MSTRFKIDNAVAPQVAPPATPRRPPVSVVVPFSGDQGEADELCTSLRRLDLCHEDEIVLVDNSPVPLRALPPSIRHIRATEERSSYYARNVGVTVAKNEWILFMDGDCRPRHTDMLDRLFTDPLDVHSGAVAGGVVDAPAQTSLLARHARSRRYLDQRGALSRPRPFGLTANLMVRRSAWAELGGFCEGIRSGGDQDFGWRLHEAGWSIEWCEAAAVDHLHQERLRPAMRKFVRYGAGSAWLSRRDPSVASLRPPLVRGLGRAVVGAVVWLLTRRPERAAFKLIDGLIIIAVNGGYLLDNRPPPASRSSSGPVVGPVLLIDEVPSHYLDSAGIASRRVEALRRAKAPHAETLRDRAVVFAEDDGLARRILNLAWILLRRPRALLKEVMPALRVRGGTAMLSNVACAARRAMVEEAPLLVVARGAASIRRAACLERLLEAFDRGGTGDDASCANHPGRRIGRRSQRL